MTMEIAMHRTVARILSMLNIRVIDGFVATTARIKLHRIVSMQAGSSVTIDGITAYHIFDGSDFSNVFQWSNELHGSQNPLETLQQQVLDLLFGSRAGTGLTIFRGIIGSSPNSAVNHVSLIEPHCPGLASLRQIAASVWGLPGY